MALSLLLGIVEALRLFALDSKWLSMSMVSSTAAGATPSALTHAKLAAQSKVNSSDNHKGTRDGADWTDKKKKKKALREKKVKQLSVDLVENQTSVRRDR